MKKWIFFLLLVISLSCDNNLTSKHLFHSENKRSLEGFIEENTDKEN